MAPLGGYLASVPMAQPTNYLQMVGGGRTRLPPDQEAKFQSWITELPWYKEFIQNYGEQPNLDAPEYDYRRAWQGGVVPQRDPYDSNRYHWSSSLPDGTPLKSADHPTMWKEHFMRQTGKNPDELGLRDPAAASGYLRGGR